MWIIFALASRIFWAGCNAVDQVYARMHGSEGPRAATVLQLCLALPFSLICLYLAKGPVFAPVLIGWTVLNVCCYVGALLPYFKVMEKEQAYNVVPFFEIVPVLLITFAWLYYHEPMRPVQMAGAAIVLACGFVFSWDFADSRIKTHVLLPMMISCVLLAVCQFTIRAASQNFDVWAVSGMIFLAEAVVGLIGLGLLGKTRRAIVQVARDTNGKNLKLGFLTQLFCFIALLALSSAFKMAPTTTHVAALSGTQPFFSFFLAVILCRLMPRHYDKISFDREVKIKLSLIIGIIIGICLLTQY